MKTEQYQDYISLIDKANTAIINEEDEEAKSLLKDAIDLDKNRLMLCSIIKFLC